MAKYRKRPIVIEAVQITDRMRTGIETLPLGVQHRYDGGGMVINTLEGRMKVGVGDWIITGVKGEKYPCKPDIFEATYEKVQDIDLKETEIEKLAKKAARTGNRSDLQAYLKARRNNA